RESVAGWFFQTARHLAMKARTAATRRARHEGQVRPAEAPPDPLAELSFREVRAAVAEELARLPEALRAPLLLTYWEGATNEAAAGRRAGLLGEHAEAAAGGGPRPHGAPARPPRLHRFRGPGRSDGHRSGEPRFGSPHPRRPANAARGGTRPNGRLGDAGGPRGRLCGNRCRRRSVARDGFGGRRTAGPSKGEGTAARTAVGRGSNTPGRVRAAARGGSPLRQLAAPPPGRHRGRRRVAGRQVAGDAGYRVRCRLGLEDATSQAAVQTQVLFALRGRRRHL